MDTVRADCSIPKTHFAHARSSENKLPIPDFPASATVTYTTRRNKMSVLHLTNESFKQLMATENRKILLDFRAEWCGPCQMLTPVLEELSNLHQDITVAAIDVDQMPEAAAKFRVDSIPALFLVKDGMVLASTVGYMDREFLEKKLGI